MAESTDRELVDAARGGDTKAFGEIVKRYQRRLYRVVVHMVRNEAEAEEVTQECFFRAYNALDRFDGRSEPFTWMYRIAVNLSLNMLRARKPRGQATPLDDPRVEGALVERRPALTDPLAQNVDRELAVALAAGMDNLSETLRVTLILVAIDGLSHTEASAVLGCPEGTIAWRVHEARKQLKGFLEAKGHELTGTRGDR
ncbi:MAG: sigma-70 family RNA polymerase sigma factor [Polyangiaceae bacterium]|nr:sigma-70 family RNA polymerase sigma factor [Polyangiaceae bacterium]